MKTGPVGGFKVKDKMTGNFAADIGDNFKNNQEWIGIWAVRMEIFSTSWKPLVKIMSRVDGFCVLFKGIGV
jgi:hypothetical protein